MKTQQDNTQESQNLITPRVASETSDRGTAQLVDNRKATIDQRKLQKGMHVSMSNNNPIQRKANKTGLPDNLKSGIENLSGYSMDDVKVHYNSSKPAQLQAHAYAQGTDIHLAPGQQKHLPHEAWHVVQQKQGRVKPTRQLKSKVNINDDAGLEKEADVMGARILAKSTIGNLENGDRLNNKANQYQKKIGDETVQRVAKKKKLKAITTNTPIEAEAEWEENKNTELGLGQAANVYKGTMGAEDVAVKVFREKGEYDIEIANLEKVFSGEKNLSGLKVIKPKGYSDEGGYVIVYELGGKDLRKELPDGLEKRLEYIYDIIITVKAMHLKGYLHGDIGQKNVVERNGDAYVTDYGAIKDKDNYSDNDWKTEVEKENQELFKLASNILLKKTGNDADSRVNTNAIGKEIKEVFNEIAIKNAPSNDVIKMHVLRMRDIFPIAGISDKEITWFLGVVGWAMQ